MLNKLISILDPIFNKVEYVRHRRNALYRFNQNASNPHVVGKITVYQNNDLLLAKLGVYPSNPHIYKYDDKYYVNLAYVVLPDEWKLVMVAREEIHQAYRNSYDYGHMYRLFGVTPLSIEHELYADNKMVDLGCGVILMHILKRQWAKKPTFVLKKRILNLKPQLTES